MELWVPVTVAAAFFQTLRTAIQKHLTAEFSAAEATYARFVWGCPLAAVYAAALLALGVGGPVTLAPAFFGWALLGGTVQVIATILLIRVFVLRSFAIGTAYSKTELVQTAVFAALFLGEPVGPGVAAAILVSLVGVLLLSGRQAGTGLVGLIRGLGTRAALLGLASGGLFGISGVSYRGAALALEADTALFAAAVTLATVTALQAVGMTLWMARATPGAVGKVVRGWSRTGAVGLTSVIGSACWFTAFALENAAHVRVLGQVELVFMFVASVFVFRERTSPREVIGILLVVGAVVLLVVRTT